MGGCRIGLGWSRLVGAWLPAIRVPAFHLVGWFPTSPDAGSEWMIHAGRLILPIPEIARDQKITGWNQVRSPHPFFPHIAAGLGNISSQGHRIFKLGRKGIDPQTSPSSSSLRSRASSGNSSDPAACCDYLSAPARPALAPARLGQPAAPSRAAATVVSPFIHRFRVR